MKRGCISGEIGASMTQWMSFKGNIEEARCLASLNSIIDAEEFEILGSSVEESIV